MRFVPWRFVACVLTAPFAETTDYDRADRSRWEYGSGEKPPYTLSALGVLNGLLRPLGWILVLDCGCDWRLRLARRSEVVISPPPPPAGTSS